jgi:hypothetical protein
VVVAHISSVAGVRVVVSAGVDVVAPTAGGLAAGIGRNQPRRRGPDARARTEAGLTRAWVRTCSSPKAGARIGGCDTTAADEQGHSLERADSRALCANRDTTAAAITRDDRLIPGGPGEQAQSSSSRQGNG